MDNSKNNNDLNYDNKKEICKLIKPIPLDLFQLVCRDINTNEPLNKHFKFKVTIILCMFLLFISLFIYVIIFNKRTKIISSKINIGIFFGVCIVLSIYYTLMTFLEESLQGETGDVGPPGQKGDKGQQGLLGQTGFKGAPGEVGPDGDTGPIGKAGPIGNIGPIGIRGIRGDRGAKGMRGYKGLQGPQGIRGKPGINGLKGPKGPKGDDNNLKFIGAILDDNKTPDNSLSQPVFTYNSEFQKTNWRDSSTFYDVNNDIGNMLKCDKKNSIEKSDISYNECKDLCTNEVNNDGYKKCVGIYGDIDKQNPDTIKSKCYICPEIVKDLSYLSEADSTGKRINLKLNSSSQNPRPTYSWENFVTGFRLKTIKKPGEENDSAHVFLKNIIISSKK